MIEGRTLTNGVCVDGIYFEQTFKVERFKQILRADGSRSRDLIQFWAAEGGLRTVADSDIVKVR